MRILLPLLACLTAAPAAERFTLDDGRNLVGDLDQARQVIVLAGPIAGEIALGTARIVAREPAPASVAEPPPTPEQQRLRRIAGLVAVVRGLERERGELAAAIATERRKADAAAAAAETTAKAAPEAEAANAGPAAEIARLTEERARTVRDRAEQEAIAYSTVNIDPRDRALAQAKVYAADDRLRAIDRDLAEATRQRDAARQRAKDAVAARARHQAEAEEARTRAEAFAARARLKEAEQGEAERELQRLRAQAPAASATAPAAPATSPAPR